MAISNRLKKSIEGEIERNAVKIEKAKSTVEVLTEINNKLILTLEEDK